MRPIHKRTFLSNWSLPILSPHGPFALRSAERDPLHRWLDRFPLDAFLRPFVVDVFRALPTDVRIDLVEDPGFMLYDYEPGRMMHVPVASPGRDRPSRSVVLKRTLRYRSEPFIRWLIAHEIAHAHLRHGGRWPGEDPELAADALAATWGFPRPPRG